MGNYCQPWILGCCGMVMRRDQLLLLELGRYRRPKVPRSERICPVCNVGPVEDEIHFIIDVQYSQKQGNLYCIYKCANLILKSYYYFDSEAILLTFELIVIVSLKPLSVSVRCMSHLNKIYYHYYYYYCRETSLSQIVVDNQFSKSHRISDF